LEAILLFIVAWNLWFCGRFDSERTKIALDASAAQVEKKVFGEDFPSFVPAIASFVSRAQCHPLIDLAELIGLLLFSHINVYLRRGQKNNLLEFIFVLSPRYSHPDHYCRSALAFFGLGRI